jgi:hypothetical protein
MLNDTEIFPNYLKHPDTPFVEDTGVQIRLAQGPYSFDAPLILRGAYKINQDFVERARGVPLKYVTIIIYRRDKLQTWFGPVKDAHNVIPAPPNPNPVKDASYREGGYFNLDLIRFGEVKEHGRYWVMAAMGDAVSDRIEFEM